MPESLKFSILLPTRNRTELLRYALLTVLGQDYREWEVIVSDNDSDEDVQGLVESFREPRFVYKRTASFVPVTDNWNLALESSTGDYVIMLGDDDCLLQGCLAALAKLAQENAYPALIYTQAVQFAYPGVMPGSPDPFIQFGFCEFLDSVRAPCFLDRKMALRMVRESMHFRIAFGYNMQHFVIGRELIKKMTQGKAFFRSPYPDYYAGNASLLIADRVLVCPYPLVAIGISPKSFGFYYFNQRENEGVEFLRNVAEEGLMRRVASVVLPGTNMNTSWLLAMEAVRQDFGARFGLTVSHWRYRFMQFGILFRKRNSYLEYLRTLLQLARPGEFVFYAFLTGGVVLATRCLPRRQRIACEGGVLSLIHRSHPRFDPRHRAVPYRTILELYQQMKPAELMPLATASQ